MSVIWTPQAEADLAAIQAYVARTAPVEAARLAARIVDRSDTLDGMPLLGAAVPERGDPALREVFEPPYRIIYRVVGADVRVQAVVHAARGRLPRGL